MIKPQLVRRFKRHGDIEGSLMLWAKRPFRRISSWLIVLGLRRLRAARLTTRASDRRCTLWTKNKPNTRHSDLFNKHTPLVQLSKMVGPKLSEVWFTIRSDLDASFSLQINTHSRIQKTPWWQNLENSDHKMDAKIIKNSGLRPRPKRRECQNFR